MVQKSTTKLTFKKAWTFPEEVEKRIARFVSKHPGLWLHAPVGISKLGQGPFGQGVTMLTLDINDKLKPDIVCDIFKMNEHPKIKHILEEEGGFAGVISDPLWYVTKTCTKCGHVLENETKGLAYPERRHLSYQLRDVVKPGGKILFNGLWNPIVKGLRIDKVEIPTQAYTSFRNVSLLVYMTKVNERITI